MTLPQCLYNLHLKLNSALCITAFCFFSFFSLQAQKSDPDHKLLWRIISPTEAQESYVYGTMHVEDSRVFKFTDSLYVKIEECKHFALEVHPDSMIKTLIVDPFNASVNQSFLDEMESEELIEINKEIEEKTGINLEGIVEENRDLIPLLLDKIFKKEKDKNTFLDAHLYHIARILEKNIVGLESISDHKKALDAITSEKPDLKTMIENHSTRIAFRENLIEKYTSGRYEELFFGGIFEGDSLFQHRNVVMVNSAKQYIEDGGLFMAVGAAHLAGEKGVLNLLREEGYRVEPVKVRFSKKIINAQLAERKLDWVEEIHPDEGLSVKMPDNSYNYLPASMVGMVKVRSYPDLGLGHFFFYSALPMTVSNYGIKEVEEEFKTKMKNEGARILEKNIKRKAFQGHPMLEIKLYHQGSNLIFRYIAANNFLYTFGITKINKGELDEKIVERYFKNVKILDIANKETELHTDEKGAFVFKKTHPLQTFTEVDDSYGQTSRTEFHSFFDQNSGLINMVTLTTFEAGGVVESVSDILENYEDAYLTPGDSLIYARDSKRYGGREILIESSDGTFMKAIGFVRGNRTYQLFCSGGNTEENLQKSDAFMESFDTISYTPYELMEYHTPNFSIQFPSICTVDTITDTYELSEYVTKCVKYAAMDENSSMNVMVEECTISPYMTYDNIDTCYSLFQESFLNFNDTLIYSNSNGLKNEAEFDLYTRNTDNQLDYKMKIIFAEDKVYKLYLVQDSSAIKEAATRDFLESFKLKNRKRKLSYLFRDSTSVKRLTTRDINNPDTSVMKAAAAALYNYTYSKQEYSEMLSTYSTQLHRELPASYHRSMLTAFRGEDLPGMNAILEQLYLKEEISDDLKLYIIELLLGKPDTADITLVKSLLQKNTLDSVDTWEIEYTFATLPEDLPKMKPLFPELLDVGVRDSVIILSHLFHSLLEKEVIDYQTLKPIHELITTKSKEGYQKILEEGDDDSWSYKSDLFSILQLSSFTQQEEDITEIYQYFFSDSSYYYKIESAECLLRQGISLDLSGLYETFAEYAAKKKMYELESNFKGVNILPDSMQTLSQYAKVAAIAYAEENEYFDNSKVDLLDSYEDETRAHYFYNCEVFFDYDEDESYKLVIYCTVKKQAGDFTIPPAEDVYVDYLYLKDEGVEETKKVLLETYEENKKEN